jgi:hypothetical protein
MQSIDIDFEVFKALTIMRNSEKESYNDVLRGLLKLPSLSTKHFSDANTDSDWVTKGIHFPEGTEFRARYKGRNYEAQVRGGSLHLDGKTFNSVSSAAMSITQSPVNGWIFWECRFPGQSTWKNIRTLKG